MSVGLPVLVSVNACLCVRISVHICLGGVCVSLTLWVFPACVNLCVGLEVCEVSQRCPDSGSPEDSKLPFSLEQGLGAWTGESRRGGENRSEGCAGPRWTEPGELSSMGRGTWVPLTSALA